MTGVRARYLRIYASTYTYTYMCVCVYDDSRIKKRSNIWTPFVHAKQIISLCCLPACAQDRDTGTARQR